MLIVSLSFTLLAVSLNDGANMAAAETQTVWLALAVLRDGEF